MVAVPHAAGAAAAAAAAAAGRLLLAGCCWWRAPGTTWAGQHCLQSRSAPPLALPQALPLLQQQIPIQRARMRLRLQAPLAHQEALLSELALRPDVSIELVEEAGGAASIQLQVRPAASTLLLALSSTPGHWLRLQLGTDLDAARQPAASALDCLRGLLVVKQGSPMLGLLGLQDSSRVWLAHTHTSASACLCNAQRHTPRPSAHCGRPTQERSAT
jgi:hypothetical protein